MACIKVKNLFSIKKMVVLGKTFLEIGLLNPILRDEF